MLLQTPQTASAQAEVCASLEKSVEHNKCFEVLFGSLITENKLSEALDISAHYNQKNETFKKQCHLIMHEIGHASFQHMDQGGDITVNQNVSLCTYGFYHGLIEILTDTTGDLSEAKLFCLNIEKDKREEGMDSDITAQNCFHGIGNGIGLTLIETPQDSIEHILESASKQCTSISTEDIFYDQCMGGAATKISDDYYYRQHADNSDLNLIWLLSCRPNLRYTSACEAYSGRIAAREFNFDFVSILLNVEQNIELEKQMRPLEAAVRFHTIVNVFDIDGLSTNVNECLSKLSHTNSQSTCVNAIALGYLQGAGYDTDFNILKSICSYPDLEDSHQKGCFEIITTELQGRFPQQKIDNFCTDVSRDDISACE